MSDYIKTLDNLINDTEYKITEINNISNIKETIYTHFIANNLNDFKEFLKIFKQYKNNILNSILNSKSITNPSVTDTININDLEYKLNIINSIENDTTFNSNYSQIDSSQIESHYSNYFPNYNSPYFYQQLNENPRFSQYNIPDYKENLNNIITNKKSSKNLHQNFQKSNSQQFVSSFIAPDTPYNSILLFHEVGTGKTCAGLSIAEKHLPYYKNKILIMSPSEGISKNWIEELFSIEKEKEKNLYNTFLENSNISISFSQWLKYHNLYQEK